MLLMTCLFIGIGLVNAQVSKVTGTVTSHEDGLPVVGASVLVKGTQVGTVTDIDGKFTITNVPSSAGTLVISFIGMKTQEVDIKPVVNVVLHSDAELLDEVVVVGYGSAKKVGTVIGSISTVNSEKIAERPVNNVMDALQGQVAGLQIYTNSGDPGDKSMLPSSYLRGVGSLTAGTEPLYVLDGSPVSAEIMNMMNPNDFASVTVLKDASATSIYGSRAANGVIYITSKRGRAGEKAIVTVSGNYGWSSLARNVGSPMNASQLLDYQLSHGIINQDYYDNYSNRGVDTNWQDYFFRKNVPTYQANISVQGGGDKSVYYLSSSYYNQEGIVYGSEYERYTVRANLESQATNWLRMGINLAGAYDESQASLYTYQGSNYTAGGIFGTMLNQPYFNPYDENGNRLEAITELGSYDPNYLTDKMPNLSNQAQVNGSAFIQLTPIKGLTIRSQLGVEAYDWRNTGKRMPSYPGQEGNGYTRERFARNSQFTITNTVEYKFDINKNNHLTVLAGQEGIKTDYNSFGVQTNGQNDDRLTMLQHGTSAPLTNIQSYNSNYAYAYLSFFGRADYSYKDKYFADFSVRNDASSRFGASNRAATFFSGGLMWNLKKEAFLEDVDFLTDLRLKASVGSTGNSDIGNYDHLALVGTNNYAGASGWYISAPGNEELGWETQVLTNVGVSATFFDRIRAEITWYNRNTKDMLMEVPVPYTSGFSTITQNVGSMKNSGVELNFGFDIIKTKDMLLQFNMNYAYNKNEITELFYGYEEWPMPNYTLTYKVGEPVQFYMAKWAGVDPADGQQMWYIPGTNETTKDAALAESGALDQATGKPRYAPHNGGFNINFSWKGLSVGADFSYVLGKYLLNNDRYFSENPAALAGKNQSTDILDEWQQPGDVTDTPVFGSVMLFDTHLLENASFLRMKNLAVGYQLPKNWMENTKFIRSCKFTVSARNLFTITKYKGADPEIDTNLTYGAYPNTRQFTIGAELTF